MLRPVGHHLHSFMVILKVILFLAASFGVFTLYAMYRQAHPASASAAATVKSPGMSPHGFILLNRDEADNPRVTIMAPANCPKPEAQRARDLEAALQAAGVPCEVKDNLEISFDDPAEAERVQKFMSNVSNPLVLVRGWAKGNPMTEDIIAQYNTR